MNKHQKWRDQVASGRVFEMRSASKKHPAPCVLIVDPDNSNHRGVAVDVDRLGVIGDGPSDGRRNPRVRSYGLLLEDFTSRRVVRRRPDLECFDADDIALIRYGIAVQIGGELKMRYNFGTAILPSLRPMTWTVFWMPDSGNPHDRHARFNISRRINDLMHGAWHFEQFGGRRSLGYTFDHAWITAHTDQSVLRHIESLLRDAIPTVIRQEHRIVRWHDWATRWTYIWRIGPRCPVLGMGWEVRERSDDAWTNGT
jgi:hypothetical protein